MTIDMEKLRKDLMLHEGLTPQKSGNRLPKEFSFGMTSFRVLSVYKNWCRTDELPVPMGVRVMSTVQAQTANPRGNRPHRILVWCDRCNKWVFAGKYGQHARMIHKGKVN